MQFVLSDKELEKIHKWSKKQDKKAGTDYYGAIGGQLTYSFTPNSLGCVVKVIHDITKEELDLTDYEW